ncbi:RNA-binding domain-containing protein [Rozella allomycis CSF55]|uniref:RNA recognition motif domain-containing protein n=1 Tax=Rozella allomycis (strain CSF55) TaxID=988480 RepID=A0A075B1H8_ROZAC|nr:RNA recognition motif domain-containing protein [Rozella allomycis CSF55]RKP18684.1 RNA-binding domain-containing protein [Rozella allomycis CSF55]|eukprot:EPZ36398.1 RNA recognition motif domain-containing protein [Rozella allomycis CSF55]
MAKPLLKKCLHLKKKKGIKMSLGEFFEESGSASAVQRMEESVPSTIGSNPIKREFTLPDNPPYTAFIGNLSFQATEEEISAFFGNEGIQSIRLIRDKVDNRFKGYGYVEFKTKQDLKLAMEKHNMTCCGRSIRVDVAEGKNVHYVSIGKSSAEQSPRFARKSETTPAHTTNWRSAPRVSTPSSAYNSSRDYKQSSYDSPRTETPKVPIRETPRFGAPPSEMSSFLERRKSAWNQAAKPSLEKKSSSETSKIDPFGNVKQSKE